MASYPGRKWLYQNAPYIRDDTRREIDRVIGGLRADGLQGVGVRPYAAGGISDAVAVIYSGHGMLIARVIYQR